MLLNIRTAADVRAALYTLLPIISTLLVGYGVLTDQKAALWTGLVTAVLGPVWAAIEARTINAGRTAFYGVLAAVQAIAVGYGIATDGQFETWMPLVTALVGGAAAAPAVANTDTSPADGDHTI